MARPTDSLTPGDLLAAAAQRAKDRRPAGWLGKLSPEHRAVIVAAREQWRAAGGSETSNITAMGLATAIHQQFTALGYPMPQPEHIARWLTGNR
jgi:hypothetical protein